MHVLPGQKMEIQPVNSYGLPGTLLLMQQTITFCLDLVVLAL